MPRDYEIKIWGYIVNQEKKNLLGKEVHLLKKNQNNYNAYYKEIAHTYSNEEGYYEFYVPRDARVSEYRIALIQE